ncbi:hypothetical protein ACM26V_04540 [Salipaludibacillus sp. HK11]
MHLMFVQTISVSHTLDAVFALYILNCKEGEDFAKMESSYDWTFDY